MAADEIPEVFIDGATVQEGLGRYAKPRILALADELGLDPFARDTVAQHMTAVFMEGIRFAVVEQHAQLLEAGVDVPPLEVDVEGLGLDAPRPGPDDDV